MKKLHLFIATSLDNYIARKDGGIDWLFTDQDYGYQSFYETVDTVVMGRITYEQTLEFGEYPYKEKMSYVFSRSKNTSSSENVQFIDLDIIEFTTKLKRRGGKDVWLVGGSQIISVLHQAGLIDDYILFIHPVILGKGIPLFRNNVKFSRFSLKEVEKFDNGLVKLKYNLDGKLK